MESTAKPLTRETLYNEVWTEPVSVVAPRYGLSDVGLAKICRSLAIPLPSRGYWAKVKAGKVMHRVALPPLKHSGAVPIGLVKLPSEKVAVREAARKTRARVRKEVLPLPPPEEVSTPHSLVVATSKRLRRREGWPEGSLLRSAPKEVLNLSVTKDALDRALALTDTLIKALEKEGFCFEIDTEKGTTWLKWSETGTRMAFSISEHVKRSVHVITPAEERARKRYWDRSRWDHAASYPSIPHHDYTPTGTLTIEVGRWPSRKWNDTPRIQLESRLGEVIGGVIVLARDIHAKDQEEARRKEAYCLAVKRYEFLTTRRADEVSRFEALETDVTNWERAAKLRAFADAKERQLRAVGGPSTDQADWLAWARAKADWLDPLMLVSDVILDAPEPKRPGYW